MIKEPKLSVQEPGTISMTPGTDYASEPVSEAKDIHYLPKIPGYNVLREIGRGGMGVVYEAVQRDLNRPVAIKMMIGAEHRTSEEMLRFKIEAEITARIRHPNVVQVFDSGSFESKPFIVMEWVDGGTLSQLCRGKELSARDSARLMEVIARGVHAAHANGIVHRDLKPGNVLVSLTDKDTVVANKPSTAIGTGVGQSGRKSGFDTTTVDIKIEEDNWRFVPKVSDFGLAKQMTGNAELTAMGCVLGTPEYMAPEQATGKLKEIGPWSDVFSLGVMLYQLLTGKSPFKGDSLPTTIKLITESEAPDPSKFKKIPRDITTICLKCLEKSPERRYQSALEVANDLQRWLQGEPIFARPVGRIERISKWMTRRPLISGLAAALLLSVLGGIAGVTWKWREAVHERERAELAEVEAKDKAEAAIKAEKETSKAKQTVDIVNQFLIQDLIAAASPKRTKGQIIPISTVVKEAEAKIEAAFQDTPEVEASVRLSLGETLRLLGEFDRATPHLQKAVAIRRQAFGDNHIDTLKARMAQAELVLEQGKREEAETSFRDIYQRANQLVGKENDLTLDAEVMLATALEARGLSSEAEPLFVEAVELRKKHFGLEHPQTLRAMNQFAIYLEAQNRLKEAEALLASGYDTRLKKYGADHPDTLESANNLAVVREAMGNRLAAKLLYTEVVTSRRKVQGLKHFETLTAVNNLAQCLEKLDLNKEAAPLYLESVAGHEAVLGATHADTLRAKSNYAIFKRKLKELPDAEQIQRQVYEAAKKQFLPNHPDTLRYADTLAVMCMDLKKNEEAERLFREALDGRQKQLGPDHSETIQSLNNLASYYLGQNKAGSAEQLLLTGWKQLKSTPKSLRVDSFALAERYITILLRQGRFNEAGEIAREATELAKKQLPADHWMAPNLQNIQGFCLAAQREYEKAAKLMTESYQKMSTISDVPGNTKTAMKRRMASLYTAWGKPDKAKEYNK